MEIIYSKFFHGGGVKNRYCESLISYRKKEAAIRESHDRTENAVTVFDPFGRALAQTVTAHRGDNTTITDQWLAYDGGGRVAMILNNVFENGLNGDGTRFARTFSQSQEFAYDSFGRSTSEKTITWADSQAPYKITTSTTDNISYDKGQRVGWTETTQSNDRAAVDERVITGAGYDGLGRLASYNAAVYEINNGVRKLQYKDLNVRNSYDDLGRLALTLSDRAWGATESVRVATRKRERGVLVTGFATVQKAVEEGAGGGGIAGLSEDWTTGRAAVAITYEYSNGGSSLSGMRVRAFGTGTHKEKTVQAAGIRLDHYQKNMRYDAVGRVTGYKLISTQVERYQYYKQGQSGLRRKVKSAWTTGAVTTVSDVEVLEYDGFGRQVHTVVTSQRNDINKTWTRTETIVKSFDDQGRVKDVRRTTDSKMTLPKSSGGLLGGLGGLVVGALLAVTGVGLIVAAVAGAVLGLGGAAANWLGGQKMYSHNVVDQTMAYKADGRVDEEKTKAQTRTLEEKSYMMGQNFGDKMMMATDIVVAVALVVATIATAGAAAPLAAMGYAALFAGVGMAYQGARQGISVNDFEAHPDRAQAHQSRMMVAQFGATVATAGVGAWARGVAKAAEVGKTVAEASRTVMMAKLVTGLTGVVAQVGVAAAGGANTETLLTVAAISTVNGLMGGYNPASGGDAFRAGLGEFVRQAGITYGKSSQRTTWMLAGSAVGASADGNQMGATVAKSFVLNLYSKNAAGGTDEDRLQRGFVTSAVSELIGTTLSLGSRMYRDQKIDRAAAKEGLSREQYLSTVKKSAANPKRLTVGRYLSDLASGILSPFKAVMGWIGAIHRPTRNPSVSAVDFRKDGSESYSPLQSLFAPVRNLIYGLRFTEIEWGSEVGGASPQRPVIDAALITRIDKNSVSLANNKDQIKLAIVRFGREFSREKLEGDQLIYMTEWQQGLQIELKAVLTRSEVLPKVRSLALAGDTAAARYLEKKSAQTFDRTLVESLEKKVSALGHYLNVMKLDTSDPVVAKMAGELATKLEQMKLNLATNQIQQANGGLREFFVGLDAAFKTKDLRLAAEALNSYILPDWSSNKTTAQKAIALANGFLGMIKNPFNVNNIPGIELTKKLSDSYEVRAAYVGKRLLDIKNAGAFLELSRENLGKDPSDGIIRSKAGVVGASFLLNAGGVRKTQAQFNFLSKAGTTIGVLGKERADALTLEAKTEVESIARLAHSGTKDDASKIAELDHSLINLAGIGFALGAAGDLARSRFENSRDFGAGVGYALMPRTFRNINAGADAVVNDVVIRNDFRTLNLAGAMHEGLSAQSDLGWEAIQFVGQAAFLGASGVSLAREIAATATLAEASGSKLTLSGFRKLAVSWADQRLAAQGAGNFFTRWEAAIVKDFATTTLGKGLVEGSVGAAIGVGFMELGNRYATGEWVTDWKYIGKAALEGVAWAGLGKFAPPLDLFKSPAVAMFESKIARRWMGNAAEKGFLALGATGRERVLRLGGAGIETGLSVFAMFKANELAQKAGVVGVDALVGDHLTFEQKDDMANKLAGPVGFAFGKIFHDGKKLSLNARNEKLYLVKASERSSLDALLWAGENGMARGRLQVDVDNVRTNTLNAMDEANVQLVIGHERNMADVSRGTAKGANVEGGRVNERISVLEARKQNVTDLRVKAEAEEAAMQTHLAQLTKGELHGNSGQDIREKVGAYPRSQKPGNEPGGIRSPAENQPGNNFHTSRIQKDIREGYLGTDGKRKASGPDEVGAPGRNGQDGQVGSRPRGFGQSLRAEAAASGAEAAASGAEAAASGAEAAASGAEAAAAERLRNSIRSTRKIISELKLQEFQLQKGIDLLKTESGRLKQTALTADADAGRRLARASEIETYLKNRQAAGQRPVNGIELTFLPKESAPPILVFNETLPIHMGDGIRSVGATKDFFGGVEVTAGGAPVRSGGEFDVPVVKVKKGGKEAFVLWAPREGGYRIDLVDMEGVGSIKPGVANVKGSNRKELIDRTANLIDFARNRNNALGDYFVTVDKEALSVLVSQASRSPFKRFFGWVMEKGVDWSVNQFSDSFKSYGKYQVKQLLENSSPRDADQTFKNAKPEDLFDISTNPLVISSEEHIKKFWRNGETNGSKFKNLNRDSYRAGKEALAAQRGAILNPTAPVVGRSFRAFWDRLLGRREMITNASPNGPPAVRANGDNIDIPLADTVVRREPPAPTLHSMVGNDLGFQNGRPLSADNPNLQRGPPNQFRDFLEKQTFQKSERSPQPEFLSSPSNAGPDILNSNEFAIGNKIPKNISDPIIQHAESLQGNSKYPGVDKFKVVLLKKDSIIYGGVPGQSPFYTTKSTLRRFGNDANAICKGLQVVDRNGEYRPGLGAYRVKQDTYVAISITRANPQYGSGSAVQIVVKDFNSVLEPQFDYILKNRTKQ